MKKTRYKRFEYRSYGGGFWVDEETGESFSISSKQKDGFYHIMYQAARGEEFGTVYRSPLYKDAKVAMHRLIAAADEKGG